MSARPPRPTQRFKRGARPARADDFWSDSPLAPSRLAVKNHRRTIAQLLPGATLTLGRVFLRSQRSPVLRRCLGFALQPLPRVTAGAAQAWAAAAARVRQYCHCSGSSRCRTSSKTPPQTPTTGFRTGADVRPPCPCRTLNPWCPNPRCSCTRAGSSSSRPVREHLVLQADRMDARGRGL